MSSSKHPLGLTEQHNKDLMNQLANLDKFREALDLAKAGGMDTTELDSHHQYLKDIYEQMRHAWFPVKVSN